MKNETEKKQIIWVDNVKVIAIILVALGHLLQGLIKADIIQQSFALSFFNMFIYTFHVRLFFICSGFLYQKTTAVTNLSSYKHNVLKKIIALGVPYLIFSAASYLLKTVFANSVNTQTEDFLNALFIKPEAPYWFLYTLLIIFLITPTAKNKKSAGILFAVSAVFFTVAVATLKYFYHYELYVQLIYTTVSYLIWFTLGILLASINTEKIFSPFAVLSFIASGVLTYLILIKKISAGTGLSLIIDILACYGVIGFIGWLYKKNKQTPVFGFLSKYTMPIFLMHTIFAAGIRAVLLKINITNSAVHILAGLAASIVLPVIAQLIMDKIHLDIIIYPLRYIKIGKKKESK